MHYFILISANNLPVFYYFITYICWWIWNLYYPCFLLG